MIRKHIEEWLGALFNLKVVEDITQTKLEKAIAYDLTDSSIKVTVQQEKSVTFEFDFDLVYRCPASQDGIGFLSLAVANKRKRYSGMQLIGIDALEQVRHINNTEMLISKNVHAHLIIEYNEVREEIKQINFEDELPCQKSY